MASPLRPLLLSILLASAPAFGQGTETPTTVSEEDHVTMGTVEVGVGTTAATTTGSSGPKDGDGGETAARSYSCYNISHTAEYERCLRAVTAPGNESRQGGR